MPVASGPSTPTNDNRVVVDLSQLDLADLADLSNPILRNALARLIEQADGPEDACAAFDSAI
jgi:FXSXX-COOH protein